MGMNGRSHVDDYERVLKPCVNLASESVPKASSGVFRAMSLEPEALAL